MQTISNEAFYEAWNNPYRVLSASVLIGSTRYKNKLKSIEIQRIGDNSKFYGFGVCRRVNIKLIDKTNAIAPSVGTEVAVDIGIKTADGTTVSWTFPKVYVNQRNRDNEEEITSITCYDLLYEASKHTIDEVELADIFTLKEFIQVVATYLGFEDVIYENIPDDDYALNFIYGELVAAAAEGPIDGLDQNTLLPNFSGRENIRQVLDAAAEALTAIYSIDYYNNALVFKRLDKDGEPVLTITPEEYTSLDFNANRRIAGVCHTTELGDNVQSSSTTTGTIQYIRDNPFWDLREEIGEIVDNAASHVKGLTIRQFDCSWKGNILLDVGDKIKFVTTDGKEIVSYLLDDTITYEGNLIQHTRWEYSESDGADHANASSIGEQLNSTIAKVDKLNQQILLQVKKTEENTANISSLIVNAENIAASVEKIETDIDNEIEGIEDDIETLYKKVEATMTADDIRIEISKIVETDVTSVTTTTGFTFNEEGLTVSKTGSEMTTQITEDGMVVYKDDDAVLTADNQGVHAINLTATQYLVVGKYSRFEDYEKDGEPRTGCFWIGP